MEFKSFTEVAEYLQRKADPEKLKRRLFREFGRYIVQRIKEKYGNQQPGWPPTSNPTPLEVSGGLKNSVTYQVKTDRVTIFSRKEWLAIIHEFGVTYPMTDKQRKFLFAVVFDGSSEGSGRGDGMISIPARPIWRLILGQEHSNLMRLAKESLQKTF